MWTDPAALSETLIRQYGDRRTTYAWECEFRAAKQTDKESVVEFFDRLYAMAAQAFPPAAELGPDSSVMHSIVSSRFIDGLRFPLMRRSLLDHPLPNLELLKLRAMELEATELTLTRNANNTIRTNFVTDDDTAAVSDVANSRKRGRGEADGTDVTNHVSNQLTSGSQNIRRFANVQCYYCRERGHLKKDCPKLAAKRQRDGDNLERVTNQVRLILVTIQIVVSNRLDVVKLRADRNVSVVDALGTWQENADPPSISMAVGSIRPPLPMQIRPTPQTALLRQQTTSGLQMRPTWTTRSSSSCTNSHSMEMAITTTSRPST